MKFAAPGVCCDGLAGLSLLQTKHPAEGDPCFSRERRVLLRPGRTWLNQGAGVGEGGGGRPRRGHRLRPGGSARQLPTKAAANSEEDGTGGGGRKSRTEWEPPRSADVPGK